MLSFHAEPAFFHGARTSKRFRRVHTWPSRNVRHRRHRRSAEASAAHDASRIGCWFFHVPRLPSDKYKEMNHYFTAIALTIPSLTILITVYLIFNGRWTYTYQPLVIVVHQIYRLFTVYSHNKGNLDNPLTMVIQFRQGQKDPPRSTTQRPVLVGAAIFNVFNVFNASWLPHLPRSSDFKHSFAAIWRLGKMCETSAIWTKHTPDW